MHMNRSSYGIYAKYLNVKIDMVYVYVLVYSIVR